MAKKGSDHMCPSLFSSGFRFNDDRHFTFSSTEQKRVEDLVEEKVADLIENSSIVNGSASVSVTPTLMRTKHVTFLRKGLASLSQAYESLDASQPWLVYWIVHSLNLLEEPIPEETVKNVVKLLNACQNPTGGYGGGPGQLSHLATTYAAVMALSSTTSEEALKSIDRKNLYDFLMSVKHGDGGFAMHTGGEVDVRGTYCALAVATLTNIATPELFDKTAEWVVSCQTYEGGFSACAGTEAHGGYTFCGLASLIMLGRDQLVEISSLLKWLAFKQMKFEGGFQGRTNKLVDGCYSFWLAACFPLIHEILVKRGKLKSEPKQWLLDSRALQHYILVCCQWQDGGLIDKPGKRPDYYHTCYTLSGLSLSQHLQQGVLDVVGPEKNKLAAVHPVYNVTLECERKARQYFGALNPPS